MIIYQMFLLFLDPVPRPLSFIKLLIRNGGIVKMVTQEMPKPDTRDK